MGESNVLVDAGPLVSIIRRSQPEHESCCESLLGIQPPMTTCWPVLAEAAYLLRSRPNEVRTLLAGLGAGLLRLAPLEESDAVGIQGVLDRFSDQKFQLADAALMWIAERDGFDAVFTLDRRDFSVYRRMDGKALRLIPVVD